MSYICMLANEQGIAVAGDSRLTLFPIPLHLDRTRKVFSAPEQHLVWACCGLTVWGGVNFAHLTARIMRRPWPLERKLAEVERRIAPILRLRRKVQRGDALFTLLVGAAEPGDVQLITLDLVNGAARQKRWDAPAMTEAGVNRTLRPPLVPPRQFRDNTPEELGALARQRVEQVTERDRARSEKEPAHRQTVGGPVRWAVVRASEGESPQVPL